MKPKFLEVTPENLVGKAVVTLEYPDGTILRGLGECALVTKTFPIIDPTERGGITRTYAPIPPEWEMIWKGIGVLEIAQEGGERHSIKIGGHEFPVVLSEGMPRDQWGLIDADGKVAIGGR